MHDKKTLITVIITILVIIAIFVGNHIYKENNYFELNLICEYNSKYTNYEETLTFGYVNDVLYEYTREELMSPTGSTTMKDLVDFFNGEKEYIAEDLSDDIRYEVYELEDKVKIRTYIKAILNIDFYNSYIEEKGITMESSLNDVNKILSDEYTCHTEKVW